METCSKALDKSLDVCFLSCNCFSPVESVLGHESQGVSSDSNAALYPRSHLPFQLGDLGPRERAQPRGLRDVCLRPPSSCAILVMVDGDLGAGRAGG